MKRNSWGVKRFNITRMLLLVSSVTIIVAIILSAGCTTDPRKVRIDSAGARGFDNPQKLTDAQQQRILEIILNTNEAREHPPTKSIYDTRLLWTAFIWDNSGYSYMSSVPFENWEADPSYKAIPESARWYPGAVIRFGDPPNKSTYWFIQANVDLEANKVVYISSMPYGGELLTAPTPNPTEQYNAGQEFVRAILDLLQDVSGWGPPLPPSGGERPRTLTEEEKDRVLKIASAVPQVVEAKRNKDVVSVDTHYLWVGWNGGGVSYLGYEAVEKGTVSQGALSAMGDECYPAVDFVFNSKFGEYGKAGIHVAVNLETGRVVYLDGFSASAIPRKLPPPVPSPVSPQQSSELPLRIISLTSPIDPGLDATLVIETLPGAECSAIVDYGPSGNSVLRSQVADGNGKVSWTWTVGRFSGNWQITVKASYGGKSTSTMTPFTVR